MMPSDGFTLKVIKGPLCTQAFVFSKNKINIGSSYAQNDFIMNVEGIAARCAKIWRRKNKYIIQNLSDDQFVIGNGGFLKKKETYELKTGTKISMGKIGLLFINGGMTGSTAIETNSRRKQKTGGGRNQRDVDRHKKIKLISIGCVALSIFIILITTAVNGVKKDNESSKKASPVMSSEEPIELPAKGKYGYIKNNDKTHPDKAVFTFKTDASNIELYYTAGSIDSEKEVSISLNGQFVGYAPLAKGAWGKETVVRLPKDLLTKGGDNYLIFDSTENPPNLHQWAVKNVRVKALPANLCDADKAKKLFELGEEIYKNKSISKGNLYMAGQYYSESVSHLQDCGEDIELLRQAALKKDRLIQELDTLHKSLQFAFKKAYQLSDYTKCRSILQDIVLHFPDKSDERHKQAAEKLEEYNLHFQMRRK